jgi:choline kinase
MQAIIIGAGRGARLMPTTADAPKCFAEVGGRRLLDWALEAFRVHGVERVCFIGGYQIDKVRQGYPRLTFRHNADWEGNNILASLFHAEDLMGEGFVCCYSDILFTPRRYALARPLPRTHAAPDRRRREGHGA